MMRFLPVSGTAFLVELPDLDKTLALFTALQSQKPRGVEEMIPAARTVLISFSPYETNANELAGQIARLDLTMQARQAGESVAVPVDYNGEDLPEVAERTGLTVAEIIHRHTAPDYVVAFCGFAPGFGYLTGGDPALQVPRRTTPRTRIPAGAVGLAGPFTGVYPRDSPGGWQIIGTTQVKMWDLTRTPPAFFQPGSRVRFFDRATAKRDFYLPSGPAVLPEIPDHSGCQFLILAAPLPALFQDLGRFGQTDQGVSRSGALDRGSFKAANRLVGNEETTPCLELTGGGFQFRATGRVVIALTGAPCELTIRPVSGSRFAIAFNVPVALEPGDEVMLSAPQAGVRSYMAVRGGFAVDKVLGSAATDTLACLGPQSVRVGDRLTVNAAQPSKPVSVSEIPAINFPKPGDIVKLDMILGPRADWFEPEAVRTLCDTSWEVTARSDRVGVRLDADTMLKRSITVELPSEACVAGALEVPPDGKPLLLLADHPLTGGYPVIGTVTDDHLDLAGQIPVGAKIQFRPLGTFADITPTPEVD